jgi:hypothetical protein
VVHAKPLLGDHEQIPSDIIFSDRREQHRDPARVADSIARPADVDRVDVADCARFAPRGN